MPSGRPSSGEALSSLHTRIGLRIRIPSRNRKPGARLRTTNLSFAQFLHVLTISVWDPNSWYRFQGELEAALLWLQGEVSKLRFWGWVSVGKVEGSPSWRVSHGRTTPPTPPILASWPGRATSSELHYSMCPEWCDRPNSHPLRSSGFMYLKCAPPGALVR